MSRTAMDVYGDLARERITAGEINGAVRCNERRTLAFGKREYLYGPSRVVNVCNCDSERIRR